MAITGRVNAFPFDRTFLSYPPSSPALSFRTSSSALSSIGKEEVKVEVEKGNVLRIRGERAGKAGKWSRLTRGGRKFLRRFMLPENVKTDRIEAAMENGVPKEEAMKPEVKSVEVSC